MSETSDDDVGAPGGPDWAALAAQAAAEKAAKAAFKESLQAEKAAIKAEKRAVVAHKRHLKRQQLRRRKSVGPFAPDNRTPLAPGAGDSFSLRDRHVIRDLATRMEGGANVEFLLWDELRAALRGNLRNLRVLADSFAEAKTAQGVFEAFEPHNEFLIEQVINKAVTLDQVDITTLHLLLSRGADPNVVMVSGTRPLHVCCLRCLPAAVEVLLEYSADMSIACTAGYTPLHYACLSGAAKCAVLLSRMGASIQALNRAGHMPLECAEGPGFEKLKISMDRVRWALGRRQAIDIRREALVRAKQFYVKQMEGDPTYIGPWEDRCPEFYDGRILAAVMVLHPSWISGKRERLKLIPADLDDLSRLARKVFGKHHEKKVDMFKYDHPKYSSVISKVVFGGQLSAKEVMQCLQDGEDRYERSLVEQAERDKVRAYEKAFEDFIDWLREADEMHQRYIQYHIASLCEPRSPICLLNVQKIVEATTGFSIYQWEALNYEERGVLESLRQLYSDREGHLFADEIESSSEEEDANRPKGMGAAARAALKAAEEEAELVRIEQDEADERKERHDRGSYTASTYSYTDGSSLGTARTATSGK